MNVEFLRFFSSFFFFRIFNIKITLNFLTSIRSYVDVVVIYNVDRITILIIFTIDNSAIRSSIIQ